jgi:hypothetical protein
MLSALSSFLLAALSGTAMAQPRAGPAPQAQQGAPQTIVVTGERVADFRNRLAACLARHCPPNEDIDATTALAEVLFVDGEYREARTVLLASIGRNRHHAAQYPEPVSDLYRANALVARHLGFDLDAQRSTWEILHALQRGIPVEDGRHFTARLEVVESLIAFGEYYQARQQLRELQERARAAGRDDVVATAELREIWLQYLQGPDNNAIVRQLTDLAASTEPRRSYGAKMLLIRIYNARGQRREADRLIAQLGGSGTHRRLLFAPDYVLAQQDNGAANSANGRTMQSTANARPPRPDERASQLMAANNADRMTDLFDDQMIDVGFRIKPDGTVADVQIVNRRGSPGWDTPLVQSIAGRRYAIAEDGSETYRLERYTYTSERRITGLTATRISNRSPRGRVEFRELNETHIPATPPAGPR